MTTIGLVEGLSVRNHGFGKGLYLSDAPATEFLEACEEKREEIRQKYATVREEERARAVSLPSPLLSPRIRSVTYYVRRPNVFCAACGSPMYRRPAELARCQNNYCCRSCRNQANVARRGPGGRFTAPGSSTEEQQPSKLPVGGSIPSLEASGTSSSLASGVSGPFPWGLEPIAP